MTNITNTTDNSTLDYEIKCDNNMLKKHIIAIEQVDGNMSATCDKPSDFEMNESLASFTNVFQTGNITLSSSMNES